jgi:hypothetical protein
VKLFLVESPLQLVNAREAQRHFQILPSDSLLLVLKGVSALNHQQTLALIQEADWFSVKSMGHAQSVASFIVSNRRVRAWLARWRGQVDQVIIGDIRPRFMRHVANGLGQPVVLLDDGTATLTVADKRRQNISPNGKYARGWRRFLNKRTLLGHRDHDIPSLTFFTTFNFEVPVQDRVVRHQYAGLRESMAGHQRLPVWYFIGCPLVEMGIVSRTRYQAYLEHIAGQFSETVCYIPHRREDIQRVRGLATSLHWQVKSFDKPLELALLERGDLPLGLIGLYSTALDNGYTLFGEQLPIYSYEIPGEDILVPERKMITVRIYDYYRQNYLGEGFQIRTLRNEAIKDDK